MMSDLFSAAGDYYLVDHETSSEGYVQANSMGLNNQGGCICRIRPIGAHRSRSPVRDRESPRTRGDLDGDHGNCRRISLWNFGREPQIRTALWSHTNPKTLPVCVFFRTILSRGLASEK
jgi:hypothetical protein